MAVTPRATATKQRDGQITSDLQKSRQAQESKRIKNISVFFQRKSLHINCHPVPRRGAYHDRHETWDGMRWTLVVPITNGARAYGEIVWS